MLNENKTLTSFANCGMNITAEAMEYLSKKTKGITYYDIFLTILRHMVTEPCTVASGFGKVSLKPGQVALSNEQLAAEFKLNPKTMKNIVNEMARLKLIAIHRTTTTTVIDMVALSGWFKDGHFTKNHFHLFSKTSVAPTGTQNTSTEQSPTDTQKVDSRAHESLL